MLFIQLFLDEYRYILSTSDVIEIVPGIKLTHVPNVPKYVSGLCNYRGDSVPVVDLCELILNRPSSRKLSTRIILMKINIDGVEEKTIGLMVEKATETVKIEEESFIDSGVHNKDMPFIGPVVADGHGLVTRIMPGEIFRKVDKELLFVQK